jgi:pilus assembly protein CpaE
MSQYTHAAPEFDPVLPGAGEEQDFYPGDRARPVPRISIQDFSDEVFVATAIQFDAEDRRLDKAHVRVHKGVI